MKNKFIGYSFGISPDKKEWVVLIKSDETITVAEYIEAMELWIKHFKSDETDILGACEIMSNPFESTNQH